MKKLFIHIGLPKTATSSIQSFLYDNNDFLSEQGFHYIKTGLSQSLKCHHDIVWKLGLHIGPSYVEKDIQKYKDEILSGLFAENEKYSDKDLILSSELLTFLNDYEKLNPILEVFNNREIKFIINIRRQDRFLESLYQQVVKDGTSLSFAEWLKQSREVANYNKLINKLLKITSKENIIIDIFDTNSQELFPVEKFLISLGFDEEFILNKEIKNSIENESLSKEQIEIIRKSNKLDYDARYKLLEKFLTDNQSNSIDKASYLNDKQRENIINSFRKSNDILIESMDLSDKIASFADVPLPKNRDIVYHIDHKDKSFISGWCFDKNSMRNPVKLELYIDDKKVYKEEANKFRKDFFENATHPTGNVGFQFNINSENIKDNSNFILKIQDCNFILK